jgi:ADP-heptose:LPS heptosyltransferase
VVYGHVADTLAAVPALRSLRRALPSARIELLCLTSVAPLLRLCPYDDGLVTWDDFKHKQGRAGQAEKVAVLASLSLRLRRRRYDAVLVFHRSFRALRRLATLCGASVVAGVSSGGDGYSHPVPPPSAGLESSREENARVLAAVGVEEDGGPLEVWAGRAEESWAEELLGRDGDRPLVGLHAGSDWSCQQWLPERFGEVGTALQRRARARIVTTGSAGEVPLQEDVAGRLSEAPVRCAGRTTLGQLVPLIRRLDLLICVNSAAAAIARAVGTPAVILLGPEDARLTGLEPGRSLRVLQPGHRLRPGSWCEFGRWGILSGCDSPMCRGLSGLDQLEPGAVTEAGLDLLALSAGRVTT